MQGTDRQKATSCINKKRLPQNPWQPPLYHWKLLFTFLHVSLQLSEHIKVAERSTSLHVVDDRSVILLARTCVVTMLTRLIVTLLKRTAVREDDTVRILVELNHLERQLLTELSL